MWPNVKLVELDPTDFIFTEGPGKGESPKEKIVSLGCHTEKVNDPIELVFSEGPNHLAAAKWAENRTCAPYYFREQMGDYQYEVGFPTREELLDYIRSKEKGNPK